MSIQSLIDEIIADFKAGLSIDEKLEKINSDTDQLHEWVFIKIDDGLFDTNVHSIISKDSLKERFSDYYNHDLTEDERLETNDDEIWDYFSDLLNEEDVEMLVLDEIDGVTFAMVSHMPPLYQHKNLKLYEDQNAALQDYIKADFFIQDISSEDEVVKYLSDNVINKPVS